MLTVVNKATFVWVQGAYKICTCHTCCLELLPENRSPAPLMLLLMPHDCREQFIGLPVILSPRALTLTTDCADAGDRIVTKLRSVFKETISIFDCMSEAKGRTLERPSSVPRHINVAVLYTFAPITWQNVRPMFRRVYITITLNAVVHCGHSQLIGGMNPKIANNAASISDLIRKPPQWRLQSI